MHPYEPFVHKVAKPARYLGGEYNAVVKPWDSVAARFVLAFPDVYDIGMSHLGTKILYSIVNGQDDLLMERCFCPWLDMEKELRERGLPLLSLENHRPLRDFDVVGFSLQYEMTFTNVLTMLDLGGIPLRAADRAESDPLVFGGGPTATHPEPVAPFFDAFVIGDAEEKLPALLRMVARARAEGKSRRELLVELAASGGVYCPALYTREEDPRTGLLYVSGSVADGVPDVVEREVIPEISRYRFPDDSPVPVAEAIFDRMSVEIARGCTEGCRFCQAGMIYRPVRERDPDQVVETVLSALDKGGFDEASVTSLSTADYSCISPLIRTLMEKLRDRRVSLGISSLRAYGLDERTFDEIATVKATGLTFAPEAGTQRMRDVINKNVTEQDIFETCHRVFSRGWNRMKLYFILGLPTETEEDVRGIAEMGRQARRIGREYQRDVNVTISVSSHVPKPHTPFQWAAMDSLESIDTKQRLLFGLAKTYNLRFRRHDARVSFLEAIITRGDVRAADLIEDAWRRGARFDGWDDQLRWDVWMEALAAFEQATGLERTRLVGTLPTDARLPWDHIDVGLEDGFLLREYRRAVAGRLSPPCGKPAKASVHHTNVRNAVEDERRLVCYDCGIACDLGAMRQQRVEFLEALGAMEPEGEYDGGQTRTQRAHERFRAGLAPHEFEQGEPARYRLRFTKLGPVALEGHLDLVRTIPRVLTRAGYTAYFSRGFSPKPQMSFGPALGLGARALGELVDVTIAGSAPEPAELLRALNRHCSPGLLFTGARALGPEDAALSKLIERVEYLIALPDEALAAAGLSTAPSDARAALADRLSNAPRPCEIVVARKGGERTVDIWATVERVELTDVAAFDLDGDSPAGSLGVLLTQRVVEGGTVKPHEVVAALLGVSVDTRSVVRLLCAAESGDPLAVGPEDRVCMLTFAEARRQRAEGELARRRAHAASLEVPAGTA